jgi:GNAT superfamily N-acetyltransferase
MHVDATLARRLEAAEEFGAVRYAECLAQLDPASGATSIAIGGGHAGFSGAGSPATQAVNVGMAGPVSGDEFDQLEYFYFSRGSACQIVVCPLADPSFLGFIRDRGYRIAEFNSVLMRSISPGESLPSPAAEIELRRVTANDADLWARIIGEGFSADLPEFSVPPGASLDIARVMRPFAGVKNGLPYLAFVDGHAAGGGGGMLLPEANIVALFGSSTLREFRGRGIQTALIRARLRDGAAAGCELAVIVTQPGSGSQRNAERCGFRLAYTKVVVVRDAPQPSSAP